MGAIVRTGDSRGFAFVRYKYQDEAQKAVEKLDGELCIIKILTCLSMLWVYLLV